MHSKTHARAGQIEHRVYQCKTRAGGNVGAALLYGNVLGGREHFLGFVGEIYCDKNILIGHGLFAPVSCPNVCRLPIRPLLANEWMPAYDEG